NHLNLLATDINAFNSKLIDYLIWYNTKRVHKGLNNLSPIDFLKTLSGVSNVCNSYNYLTP
ncbi:MAG: IS3 family transposase, partial [Caldisericota bacterium]|nr:IS3 family transposase [Thermotogota bacterium]MEA3313229.1 IS3 family transposase [Caldisericota bacterium]